MRVFISFITIDAETRRLTHLGPATIPWEAQNLLRTKSRSASSTSLRDNFSRTVTLNTRIPRLWMEFQVPQYSQRSPKILSGRDTGSPVDFDYWSVHLTLSPCHFLFRIALTNEKPPTFPYGKESLARYCNPCDYCNSARNYYT